MTSKTGLDLCSDIVARHASQCHGENAACCMHEPTLFSRGAAVQHLKA